MSYESKVESQTFFNNRIFTFVAALLTILLSLFVMIFVYMPMRPKPIDAEAVAARKKTLQEVQSFQEKVATSYMWAEKDKGIALIPIDRAMELTVKEYNTPAMEQKWAKAREEAVAAAKAKLEAAKKPQPAAATKDAQATQSTEVKPQTQPQPTATPEKPVEKQVAEVTHFPPFIPSTYNA